ncbi:hypothetical protein CAEBREN_21510 [Caenorhabditis brenneri]|uniref:peptidylprolyl isomerase n=1 Tax=Caenorhabditis brenneri TaxID=135651 RepID=G0PKB5_CAEBE|nr:hypothetical protein CAEBREN_21510 [Caenorhabditis brenneri]
MKRLFIFLVVFSISQVQCALQNGASSRKRPSSGGGLDENIPVIEIRGEGAPMSSAQIRHLEEMDNGGPLDIKGLKGMCSEELRKIRVPYRLSRKSKSKVWKNIPNDENWLIFNVEMIEVKPYTPEGQFKFLDLNEDGKLTNEEVQEFQKKIKKEFGKTWKNEDIDNVSAASYYIKYFDINGDGEVSESEWLKIMERDQKLMNASEKTKEKGRKRDPGIGWILDFNNDGIVSYKENDEADEKFEAGPTLLPTESKDEL